MNVSELKSRFVKELEGLYTKEEIRVFFNWLAEAYLGLKPFELSINQEQIITVEKLADFETALQKLSQEKPIQQILGKSHFYGLEFRLNEHTLIPRPETEELVAMIIEDFRSHQGVIRMLDIGTGSGCIPISIAKNLSQAQLYAIDIADQALKVAKQNAIENKVVVKFGQIDILKASMLSNLFTEVDQFDVIISNPPYVRELEKSQMKNNVLKYEPERALFVSDDNPLLFYDHIANMAAEHLKGGGRLYFEINQYLGKQMLELVNHAGFMQVEVLKDGFGNDRMLRAVK